MAATALRAHSSEGRPKRYHVKADGWLAVRRSQDIADLLIGETDSVGKNRVQPD